MNVGDVSGERFVWGWKVALLARLLPVLVMTGCVGAAAPKAYLTPEIAVRLPNPGALGYNWRASQLLTTGNKGKFHQMPVEVEVFAGRLTVVGFSPWGSSLWTARYDGETIEEERAPGMEGIPSAEQVLADVMLVNWPVSAWVAVLPEGWQLKATPLARRLLDKENRLIVEIHFESESKGESVVRLINHVFHYSLQIRTYRSKKS